ncbi:MAG: hypothetical protein KBF21_04740 [Thermoanaerobaculia bacterium]|nr:hypothetical protein [Thermoanaerobaculia bacterium]
MRASRFLPLLILLSLAPLPAHEPHKPALPAGSAAVAVAAIPLPEGWVESRPPAGAGAFAPMLVADGDGFLATWIEPVTPAGHRVRIARWDGRFWTFPATIREGAGLFANWADVPGVVRAPDGALYAWWLEKSGPDTYAYDVRLARSTDQGRTFEPLGTLHEDRSPVEHGFVSAVRERAGVRFYFLDGRATAGGGPMQLRTVLVEGDRIGPSELVDESVCDCCATAAVELANGSAVAYRDRTAGEIRDVQVVLRPEGAAPLTQAPAKDGWKIAGCPVNGPALAANGSQLAVAWFSAPGDRPRMAVARSADGGANWSAPESVVSSKPMGQLALAPLDAGFALPWLEGIPGGSELRLARLDGNGKPGPSLAIARTGPGRSAGIPRLAAAGKPGKRLALLWVDAGSPNAPILRFATLPAN